MQLGVTECVVRSYQRVFSPSHTLDSKWRGEAFGR